MLSDRYCIDTKKFKLYKLSQVTRLQRAIPQLTLLVNWDQLLIKHIPQAFLHTLTLIKPFKLVLPFLSFPPQMMRVHFVIKHYVFI